VRRSIKFFIKVETELYRPTEVGIQYNNVAFRSDNYIVGNIAEVNLDEIAKHLVNKLDQFNERGSGWLLGYVSKCTVSTALYRPLSGSSFIPTPTIILNKKAVVNIENNDELCFIWSVIAHLHPAKKDPNRLYHYKKFENELNVEGLTFPLAVADVAKFEKLNSNLRINVLAYEEKDFIPLYVSKYHDRPIHINLLLLSDGSKHHYTLVRCMSRLIAGRTKHDGKSFVCDHCLHPFTVKAAFERHVTECFTHAPQRVIYPEPGSTLQWKSPMKTERIPFVIYCDFESFLVPGSKLKNVIDTHIPSGFCCHTVSIFEEYATPPTLYSGEEVMEHFFTHLLDERERISKILSKNEPMKPLTDSERKQHEEATHCSVCEEPFTVDNWKVKEHCHIKGHFRRSCCNNCNLQLKPAHVQENKDRRFVINVIIHNLKGYDSHLILKHFNKRMVDKYGDIRVIASNTERYISFEFGSFRFLDSFQFMACSLDELVANLAQDGYEQFIQTNRWSPHPKLVYSKGVYPYEYMDGPLRFKETCLPPIEAFYSNLTERGISNEDYERAQTVWLTFGCETMQDYHDVYLKTDVLLLTDVFEAFRTMSLNIYKLDPAHYYTLPSLSWDALLKMTKVKLDLINDPEIYLFLENSIRGGVSMISHRSSTANNPLVEGFDESQPQKYILYLDMNNLYGFSMKQYLPQSDFRFLSDEEISLLSIDEVGDEASTGYILEVDLEYPSELHDLHNCYPLAPEKIKIKQEMLSPYSKELSMGAIMSEKLVPSLMNKTKYVLHYRNLKLYTRLGLKVTKVHRVLEFRQAPWMEPYIDLNTTQRKLAKSEFAKSLFKLLNNAVFGKTLQNCRHYMDLRLVTSPEKAKKLVAKPTYKYSHRINDDLVCIELMRPKVCLNKPIYAGFTVLELSKEAMYKFHYDTMKRRYGSNCILILTDTDSLMYEITSDENVYDHIYEDRALYDTSNYNEENKLFSKENAKVVGLMKDETGGVPIRDVVALKSKLYSFITDKSKIAAKGVKKSFITQHVTHDLFRHTLENKTVTRAKFRVICSKQHSLHTVEMDKVCLSAYDDKRYILSDGVRTLAYGHYELK